MRYVVLIVTSLGLLGFAPAPFPKTPRQRADPADVTGTWEFERYEMGGSPYAQGMRDKIEMTREKFVFVNPDGNRTTYVMRLDPSASPASFTWAMNKSVMFVGSYRFQNGRVEMIFGYNSDVSRRPTDFNSKPPYHYVLRRISR